MNGPVPYLKGKWSECHRVRNAKRPRKGYNSRTVSNYYIDEQINKYFEKSEEDNSKLYSMFSRLFWRFYPASSNNS